MRWHQEPEKANQNNFFVCFDVVVGKDRRTRFFFSTFFKPGKKPYFISTPILVQTTSQFRYFVGTLCEIPENMWGELDTFSEDELIDMCRGRQISAQFHKPVKSDDGKYYGYAKLIDFTVNHNSANFVRKPRAIGDRPNELHPDHEIPAEKPKASFADILAMRKQARKSEDKQIPFQKEGTTGLDLDEVLGDA